MVKNPWVIRVAVTPELRNSADVMTSRGLSAKRKWGGKQQRRRRRRLSVVEQKGETRGGHVDFTVPLKCLRLVCGSLQRFGSVRFTLARTMSLIAKIFGGGGKSGKAPTTQDAIQRLRETEEMLSKKQDFLEKKIDQELGTAKKYGTKNKRGEEGRYRSAFEPQRLGQARRVPRLACQT